eukprot:3692149-Pleurochrysis_carterae.AAC.1
MSSRVRLRRRRALLRCTPLGISAPQSARSSSASPRATATHTLSIAAIAREVRQRSIALEIHIHTPDFSEMVTVEYEVASPPPNLDIARYRTKLQLFVNGKPYVVTDPLPSMTLLEWLRSVGLCGTKLGCGEGGCGACTVMVSSFNPRAGSVRHNSVNACLMPVCAADQCAVITVEGIGSVKRGLHPVQQRMYELHGKCPLNARLKAGCLVAGRHAVQPVHEYGPGGVFRSSSKITVSLRLLIFMMLLESVLAILSLFVRLVHVCHPMHSRLAVRLLHAWHRDGPLHALSQLAQGHLCRDRGAHGRCVRPTRTALLAHLPVSEGQRVECVIASLLPRRVLSSLGSVLRWPCHSR